RNVGFRGTMELGSNNGGFTNCLLVEGTGTVDHVYMGDGVVEGVRAGGLAPTSSSTGHVEIHNCHFAGWTDNGISAAHTANDGRGTIHVDNCYFRDNNVAALRIASDGTVVENSVVHTTGRTPALPNGVVDAKGVYTGYGDPSQHVEVRNCDVDCRHGNPDEDDFNSPTDHPINGECSWIDVYDTQFAGTVVGNVDLVSGNGGNPDLTPPDGVPMSAEDALTGSASAVTPGGPTAIEVSPGESRRIEIGDGETLENVLVDITADGADAQIVASGDNWTVRNVGFRGTMELGSNNGGLTNCLLVEGTGTVDHVYMGDGTVDGVRAGAIGLPSSHSGHVEIRNCYIAEWTDNALYNANAADDGHGTVHVDNCYFRDNNVAALRIASDGTVVENSVVHTTGRTPALPNGVVDAKGVYTGYGDPSQHVEVRNCDVDCRHGNPDEDDFNSPTDHPINGECSWIDVYDTQFAGTVVGNVDLVSGNGGNPDLTPPDGVPTSVGDSLA
ncbi:MAG: hypothetical protein ABEJ28_07425, partial [Salinigranum sp.]